MSDSPVMAYIWKTATVITVAVLVTFVGPGPNAAKTQVPGPVIIGGGPADAEMVHWALGRYAAAGLELPSVTFEFAGPSLSECGGAQARAYLDREPALVRVCWGTEFVLLHELAHVWEARNLGPRVEAEFLKLRHDSGGEELQKWADSDLPWDSQGREHAANVIAWAVMDAPIVVGTTYPNDRASLVQAYDVLTGRQPMHTEGGEPQVVDRSAFEATRIVEPVGGR